MTNGRAFSKPTIYHIRVQGLLDEKWSDWFGGFTITPQADDETLLVGRVPDQSALHGLLAKICDLGLPLSSVQRVKAASLTGEQSSFSCNSGQDEKVG